MQKIVDGLKFRPMQSLSRRLHNNTGNMNKYLFNKSSQVKSNWNEMKRRERQKAHRNSMG